MDYCRLLNKDGAKYIPIIQKQFEMATLKEYPYYQKNSKGELKQYAICPVCENPITVVGFYNKNDKYKGKPHGRHRRYSLKGIAEYNQEAYDYCPLASRNQAYEKDARRPMTYDKLANEIVSMLISQFDRVVYLLNKQMPFLFGATLLRSMLRTYFDALGHFFMGATLENIPWIFAYMSNNQNLYGQKLYADSALANILRNCPEVTLKQDDESDLVRITASEDMFLNLTFAFVGYRKCVRNHELVELMELCIWNGRQQVYTQEIIFDTQHWFNLVNFGDGKRNQMLLKLAGEFVIA
ncbi:MAG: hypothetical protein FWE05_10575 [Defluviitaleaceae bacterium]|nr:hypothetical protein [Defluviitaleaceae bacterium]